MFDFCKEGQNDEDERMQLIDSVAAVTPLALLLHH